MQTLLDIPELAVSFKNIPHSIYAIDGLHLSLGRGETFALVGESGCGKSMTAQAILQLFPSSAKISDNSVIDFNGHDLLTDAEIELRHLRGRRIAMIFQEPMMALNPVKTIGAQIEEVLRQHFHLTKQQRYERVCTLLTQVGMPDPTIRYDYYPHQLSGGMKQRAMIAMALAGEPELLIADEPTTALDVTLQAQILQLLRELQRQTGMTLLLITHDLGIVRQIADRVAVMYAGHIVEQARVADFFRAPLHPYSQALIKALPTAHTRGQRLQVIPGQVPWRDGTDERCRFLGRCTQTIANCATTSPPIMSFDQHRVRCHLYAPAHRVELQAAQEKSNAISESTKSSLSTSIAQNTLVEENDHLILSDVKVYYPIQKGLLKRTVGHVKAVDGINLSIKRGKTLAIVGESGCGKTTLAKALVGLLPIYSGALQWNQHSYTFTNEPWITPQRSIQLVFQDSAAALNPRLTIQETLYEALARRVEAATKSTRLFLAQTLLTQVGLDVAALKRYPHEFSGGQRQRINIARSLAVNPELMLLDEPTSALDVSVQAQILNLLQDLQQHYQLTYIFITHNMGVVRYIADHVAVMYLGRIVEYGEVSSVLTEPKHPYTQMLLRAFPEIDATTDNRENAINFGEPPSVFTPPTGCHFHPRCANAMNVCRHNIPVMTSLTSQQHVRCFLYNDEQQKGTNN